MDTLTTEFSGAGDALMEGEIYTVRALELLAERSQRLELVGML